MTECIKCASNNASDSVFVESSEQLSKHIDEYHNEEISEEDENSQENHEYPCSKCSETFSNLVDLGMHLNNIHGRVKTQYQVHTHFDPTDTVVVGWDFTAKTFHSVYQQPLKVWKQTIYHWKAL